MKPNFTLRVPCAACRNENQVIAALDLSDDVDIDCSFCGRPLGFWRDLKPRRTPPFLWRERITESD